MSNIENTSQETRDSDSPWGTAIFFTVLGALLVGVPLVYALWQLFGSLAMLVATPVGYVWDLLGKREVGFLLVGAGLTGGCLIVRGGPSGKAWGQALLSLVFLFVVLSAPSHVFVGMNDLMDSQEGLNQIGPSEIERKVEVVSSTFGHRAVQLLVAGDLDFKNSKSACESYQRRAGESAVFNERYVLFVNKQRSTIDKPVKCNWFSLNRIQVGYNARYAPNGLVAQLEAFEASQKK